MAARILRKVKTVTVLFAAGVTAGLVSACGSGSEPEPDIPIPEQAYKVTVRQAQESGASCPGHIDPFSFLVLPKRSGGNSYDLYLLLDTPVHAGFSEAHLALSVPIQVTDSSGVAVGVVTFGADWTFSADRKSFSGETTFDVRTNNGNACSFTFTSVGVPAAIAAGDTAPSTSHPAGGAAMAVSARASLASVAYAVLYTATSNYNGTVNANGPVVCSSSSDPGVAGYIEIPSGTLVVRPSPVLPGSGLPVEALVVLQYWSPETGVTTIATTDFGAAGNRYLRVSQAKPGVGIWFGGPYFTGILPGVGASLEVTAEVPPTRFELTQGSGGWFKVWVRFTWFDNAGHPASEQWLEFNSAQSYQALGGSGVDSGGWCYVVPN